MLAFCDGGYTTNLPLEDLTGGKAWVAYGYDGEPLDPSTAGRRGSSSRTCTSGRAPSGCAAWPSWTRTSPGFWEQYGYHNYGDPWREQRYWGRFVPAGWSRPSRRSARRRRGRTLVLDVPDWPGHRAGQHVDVRLTAEDGYQAQRSYSIASAPGADRLEWTVEGRG